jgi:putative ATPase
MESLFSDIERYKRNLNAPLAVRMRPQTLADYVGQDEAVGEGSWLRKAIEHDALSSVVLYGPAGTGKTTLARIIANTSHAEFVEVSAITGTVKDLRREIDAAASRLLSSGRRTILFVDEIHRFNRSQQDALLHAVEDRTIVLIGATTENPYFEVNTALISRSRVVELTPLSDEAIRTIVTRAVSSPYGLDGRYVLEDDALDEIVTLAGGDARAALMSLNLQVRWLMLARRSTPHIFRSQKCLMRILVEVFRMIVRAICTTTSFLPLSSRCGGVIRMRPSIGLLA